MRLSSRWPGLVLILVLVTLLHVEAVEETEQDSTVLVNSKQELHDSELTDDDYLVEVERRMDEEQLKVRQYFQTVAMSKKVLADAKQAAGWFPTARQRLNIEQLQENLEEAERALHAARAKEYALLNSMKSINGVLSGQFLLEQRGFFEEWYAEPVISWPIAAAVFIFVWCPSSIWTFCHGPLDIVAGLLFYIVAVLVVSAPFFVIYCLVHLLRFQYLPTFAYLWAPRTAESRDESKCSSCFSPLSPQERCRAAAGRRICDTCTSTLQDAELSMEEVRERRAKAAADRLNNEGDRLKATEKQRQEVIDKIQKLMRGKGLVPPANLTSLDLPVLKDYLQRLVDGRMDFTADTSLAIPNTVSPPATSGVARRRTASPVVRSQQQSTTTQPSVKQETREAEGEQLPPQSASFDGATTSYMDWGTSNRDPDDVREQRAAAAAARLAAQENKGIQKDKAPVVLISRIEKVLLARKLAPPHNLRKLTDVAMLQAYLEHVTECAGTPRLHNSSSGFVLEKGDLKYYPGIRVSIRNSATGGGSAVPTSSSSPCDCAMGDEGFHRDECPLNGNGSVGGGASVGKSVSSEDREKMLAAAAERMKKQK